MVFSPYIDVLIVVMDEDVDKGLALSATQNGWPLLQATTADEVFFELCQCRPRVLIVQLSLSLGEALKLISLTRHHWQQVSLVAVTPSHDNQIELAVRSAGANCYLPATANVSLIEETVSAILRSHTDAVASIATTQSTNNQRRNPPRGEAPAA